MFQPVLNILGRIFVYFLQKTARVFLAGVWWFHKISGFKFPASGSVPVIFSSLLHSQSASDETVWFLTNEENTRLLILYYIFCIPATGVFDQKLTLGMKYPSNIALALALFDIQDITLCFKQNHYAFRHLRYSYLSSDVRDAKAW